MEVGFLWLWPALGEEHEVEAEESVLGPKGPVLRMGE